MKIEVNLNKKYALMLLGFVLLLAGVFVVYAVAQDSKVNHGTNQIDWDQPIPDSLIINRIAPSIVFDHPGPPSTARDWIIGSDNFGSGFSIGQQSPASASNQFTIFSNAPTNSIVVASNGNVGIGKPNPVTKLDVAGGAGISGDLDVGGLLSGKLDLKKESLTLLEINAQVVRQTTGVQPDTEFYMPCTAGYSLISCSGGCADEKGSLTNSQDGMFYIEPDLTNNRCILHTSDQICEKVDSRLYALCIKN